MKAASASMKVMERLDAEIPKPKPREIMRSAFGKYHDMSDSEEEEGPPPKKSKQDQRQPAPDINIDTQSQPDTEYEYEQPSWGYQGGLQPLDPQQVLFDHEGNAMYFDEKGELVYAEMSSDMSYTESDTSSEKQSKHQTHRDSYQTSPDEDIDEILSRYHRKIQQADEVICPPVSQKIANFFTDAFRLKPAVSVADYERDILKVPRPENIEGLKLIRTDKAVWQVLQKNQRIKEKRLAKVQNMIHKGACNIASVADDLRTAHKAKNKNMIDPNALIGQCYQL